MKRTNFFSSVAALNITGDLQLTIRKGAENNWIVSVISQGGVPHSFPRRRKAVVREAVQPLVPNRISTVHTCCLVADNRLWHLIIPIQFISIFFISVLCVP